MSNSQQKIMGDISVYSLALVFTQIVTIASSILMRRFLGPVQVGVWSLVQVVLVYAEYSNLGVLNAAAREIPYYNGKGEVGKAETIKNTVFSFSFALSTVIALGVLFYALAFRSKLSQEICYGLLFAAGLIILQRVNTVLIVFLRSYKYFTLAGKQMVYSVIVNSILVAWLSFQYQLYGFMVAMVLSLVFNIVYILKSSSLVLKFQIETKDLKPLLVYGLPLFLISLFGTFFETISKIMITRFMGLESLGVYSIALMTTASIQSIPNSVGIVVIPNLHEKYGKSDDKTELRGYLEKSGLACSLLLPIFIGLCWFLMPLLVESWLPAFTDGIRPLCYLALSAYFTSLVLSYSQFIYVIKKHLIFLPFIAVSCVVSVLLMGFAISKGYGLNGIALASTASFFVYFSLIYAYVAGHMFSFKETAAKYVQLMSPFLYLLALLFLLETFVVVGGRSVGIWRSLIFLLAEAPLLMHLEKRMGLFRYGSEKIRKLF